MVEGKFGLRLSTFDSLRGLFSAFSAALRENSFVVVLAVEEGICFSRRAAENAEKWIFIYQFILRAELSRSTFSLPR